MDVGEVGISIGALGFGRQDNAELSARRAQYEEICRDALEDVHQQVVVEVCEGHVFPRKRGDRGCAEELYMRIEFHMYVWS